MPQTSPTLREAHSSLGKRFAIIRKKMPEVEEKLDEILAAGEDYVHHEDFVEACEDYEACQRALDEPSLKDYAEEFRVLGSEIEGEVRRYLERYATSVCDDAQRHAELKKLFLRAIEVDENERGRFLDEACGGNRRLRKDVESLLSHSLPSDRPGGTQKPH